MMRIELTPPAEGRLVRCAVLDSDQPERWNAATVTEEA